MTRRSSRWSSTEPRGHTRAIYRPSAGLEKRAALVAVEGLDGSGKSTLAGALAHVLRLAGVPVSVTSWNEATEIYNLMMRLNAAGRLANETRCIFGAAELAARYQYVVQPALHRREPVIVNKYRVSAFAHALVRGHELRLVETLYDFAPEPDLTVYVDVPPAVGLERKLASSRIGFWEAGLDLSLGLPVEQALAVFQAGEVGQRVLEESFVLFQSRLRELHRQLLGGREVAFVDGTASPAELLDATLPAVWSAVEGSREVRERNNVA